MATYEIKAKVQGEEWEFVGSYDYPDTAAESVEKYGDKVVNSNFISNDKITLQGKIRAGHKKGLSNEDIQTTIVDTHVPGVASERTVDPIAALKRQYDAKTDDEKAELLARLKASLGIA